MHPVVRLALPSTAVGTLVGLSLAFDRAFERIGGDPSTVLDAASWLVPSGWSIGSTVLAYTYTARLLGFVASTVLVVGLGYWLGTRLDVAETYPGIVGGLVAGGAVGIALGGLIGAGALAVVDLPPRVEVRPPVVPAASRVLEFALLGFAGASLAHFADPAAALRTSGGERLLRPARWPTLLVLGLIGVEVVWTLGVLAVLAL